MDFADGMFDAIADIDTATMGPAERIDARLDRFGRARARTLVLADSLAGVAPDPLLCRLRRCGSNLLVRRFNDVGDFSFENYESCDLHLLCGVCAIRRSLRLMAPSLVKYRIITNIHYDFTPLFITITVKNGPLLEERFEHLVSSLSVLKKRRLDGLRHRSSSSSGAFRAIGGMIGAYEVKRGASSGHWHPHVHILALVRGRVSSDALASEWLALTGDSHIVDVRPITDDVKIFAEVFKYALKCTQMEPHDCWHARQVLAGRRLVFSSGFFRKTGCPEASKSVQDGKSVFVARRSTPNQAKVYYEYLPSGYSVLSYVTP